jgi:hypothetical protein
MGEKEKRTPFWRSKGPSIEMDIGYCDMEGNRITCEGDVEYWFRLAEGQS